MKTSFLIFCSLVLGLCAGFGADAHFELRDADRVVFLGDTLMEREQYHGYIELALAANFPDRKVSFRNLGWSADTPEGASRAALSLLQAGLEPDDEGWKQLLEQIKQTRPTVVFLGYGMANSFDGQAGIDKFRAKVNKLIETIRKQETNEVRFVIVGPIRHENLGSPLPHPAAHNIELEAYSRALQQIAEKQGFPFVSLFNDLKVETNRKASRPLTDNGIHLNEVGYQKAGEVIAESLGLDPKRWKKLRYREAIRREILKKNEIFFNRSRPQNMAYLFGFRKHEQGKNAAEIPKFDPLAEAVDERIFSLLSGSPVPAEKPQKVAWENNQTAPLPLPEFTIADGFEVTLFAESPQLAKPIQINFDPQGRLWVASSAVYPQIEPGQKPSDKIIILEDRNHDGHCDKSSVFVDGLFIPSAVAPGDGGVYVGQSTELLHFRDTDGDGKADERRVILSGFGTEDTHHTIHTLHWGPDGQLYFNQSIYIRTDTETPNGVVRLKGGGVFLLRPPVMHLEIFLRGFCNPWGQAFDRFGQSFVTDGCGDQGVSLGIREATYKTYPKMRREMASVSPGKYPKFCGLEFVHSGHFPDDWQGTLITSDFRAHRVVRFGLEEQGAGYVTKELPDVLRTTNVTFRPIDAKFGPDGALYIADWANEIINHGEVDFRDPRRDHVHGRIWRLTAKGRPLNKQPKLPGASNSDLLDQLLSVNDFNRDQARRVLTERGQKIEKDLARWTESHKNENAELEALWMYEGIGVVNTDLLDRVLRAKDGRIRAAAVRVLDSWRGRVPNAAEILAREIDDEHPRARLEAIRAIARIPTIRSAELVLDVAAKPMDNFVDYAAWLSINELAEAWVAGIESGEWTPEGKNKQLDFGLKAVESSLASRILGKLLVDRAVPKDGSGPWIEAIARSGGTNLLQRLFDGTVNGYFEDKALSRVLNALNDASRLRSLKPPGNLSNLKQLFDHSNEAIRQAAIKVAGTWKLAEYSDALLPLVSKDQLKPELRQTIFDTLREIGGEPVINGVRLLTDEKHPLAVRRSAAVALASLDLDQAGSNVIQVAVATTNETDLFEFWKSILNVKDAGLKLSKIIPTHLPTAAAKAALKAAREGGRKEPEFVLAIRRSGNLEDSDKTLTADEVKQLVESVTSKGDPAKGETIYRRSELSCAGCHAIGGAGGKVGPDLTSIGASAPVDYLIESVMQPNAKIKEGYHSLILQMKDDQTYTGILVRESDTEVVLRDASNKEMSVPKKDISERKNGASLMPSGLVDALSSDDLADLLRFLSELGKPGSFDASKGNVARLWRVHVSDAATAPSDVDLNPGETAPADWAALFTTVEGKLLKKDLNVQCQSIKNPAKAFALARLQSPNDAKVQLKLSGLEKPEVWVDGKRVDPSAPISLNQGKHTIVVGLDPQKLPENVRLESNEGRFLVD